MRPENGAILPNRQDRSFCTCDRGKRAASSNSPIADTIAAILRCESGDTSQPATDPSALSYSRIIMREIRINTSIQWKVLWISIQGRISLRVVFDRMPSQSSEHLAGPADALHGTESVAIAAIIVLFEILSPCHELCMLHCRRHLLDSTRSSQSLRL